MNRLVCLAVILLFVVVVPTASGATRASSSSRAGVVERPLVFVRFTYDGCCSYLKVNPAIYAGRLDGTGVRRLTKPHWGLWGAHPSWSPGGTRIAFARALRNDNYGCRVQSIFVMQADGTRVRRLTRGGCDSNPNWSPDGKRLVFSRNDVLWTIAPDGSRPVRLPGNVLGDEAAWSPDGRWIAVLRTLPVGVPHGFVMVMRASGSQRRFLAAAVGGRISWSPDSRALAFTTREGVAVIGRDGTGLRHLSFGQDPAWSPNGKQIVFGGDPGEGSGLFVIDADGNARRPLPKPSPEVTDMSASWRPHARHR